jgi:uncharacterized Zn-binding protein involved in type VI secretion
MDPTTHGQLTMPAVVTVLIAGMPAAVVGTVHVCALPVIPLHPPAPMPTGSATVLIGGLAALRVGDTSVCGGTVVAGAVTVLIGG